MKTLLTLTLLTLLNFATLQTTLAVPQDPQQNVALEEQPPFNSAEFSREPNGFQKVLLGLFAAVNIPGFILGIPALSFVCLDLGLATEFCKEHLASSASSAVEIRFIFGSSIVFYTVLILTLLRHKLRYLIQRLLGRQLVLASKRLTRKEILSTILLFLFAVFLFKGLYILTLALIDLLTQELALGEFLEFLELAARLLFLPTLFLLCYFFLKHKFSKKT